MFALGLFITVIQIFRIQTIKNLVNYVNSATLILWCTVEINCAIMLTCAPMLRPLVRRLRGKLSESMGSNTATSGMQYPLRIWATRKGGVIPDDQVFDRTWRAKKPDVKDDTSTRELIVHPEAETESRPKDEHS